MHLQTPLKHFVLVQGVGLVAFGCRLQGIEFRVEWVVGFRVLGYKRCTVQGLAVQDNVYACFQLCHIVVM